MTRYLLQKRLDLRLLSGISLTTHADTVLLLHFYQPTVPYRPIVGNTTAKSSKKVYHCECCGGKILPAATKQNCPGCGRLCCAKKCLQYNRPLPTLLGHSKPVRVCPNCVHGEPFEPVEDVVLMTPMKTEVVAVLRKLYRQLMGNKVPVTISDGLTYHLFGENRPWILTATALPSISETASFHLAHLPLQLARRRVFLRRLFRQLKQHGKNDAAQRRNGAGRKKRRSVPASCCGRGNARRNIVVLWRNAKRRGQLRSKSRNRSGCSENKPLAINGRSRQELLRKD
ncbi:putative myosin IB heavy chain [Trypanosoma cruzi]|uniref:Putative myosin IB heavy chain n=1 Tax=Trypanosoma cruzi TaxID=5693 RepID=A0A2V2VJM5_TRYCR|nr:putative myosin IB heavy chain [Trypanosoma cruzi]